ncbi:MAG: efflux RND transporter periplasmic adaptor subunit [Candidatus Cloacimonetes bacterium]|nr:efflux RND transporter periplasmic adaptor subunit [Candidatus Cloacimonadota bacterium]
MKNRIKKVMIWVIVVIFICLLGWRIYELISKDKSSGRGGSGGVLAVETENVKRETIREIREFSGTVRPEYKYMIAAKVAGRLMKLTMQVGDLVEADEIIGILDDAEYQIALLQAQANLADAESQLYVIEQELNRSQSLFDKEYLTLSEFEQVQAGFNSAQAKVKLADAALKLAELKLEYTKLRASRAGFIAERFLDEGSLLSVNTPVFSIVGIDKVLIKSNLVEQVYGRIKTGQQASILTDAYAGEIFTGEVSLLAPVLNEESRMAEMEINVENTNYKLKPGMFCKIKLILSESINAQTLPNKAVLSENGNRGIFIVDDNIARYLAVETGISDESRTEILKPEINKPVITLGQYQVKDGSKVNPISQ